MNTLRYNFEFKLAGYGQYIVKYVTPKRGDYWRARITDMELIDDTKNTDDPTAAAWLRLRDAVKRNGTHYRRNGERMDV